MEPPHAAGIADEHDAEKRVAASAAAALVSDGMRLGLGTGTTAEHFVRSVAARQLRLRCVATSPRTERVAVELGLPVEPFTSLDALDLAVDGADQVSSACWLVKGGGGAHTREKIVAASADRFVVVVSHDKLVNAVRPPIPLEVFAFGLSGTLRRLSAIGPVERRPAPPTPDGNVIVDYVGAVEDPSSLAAELSAVPGVVEHGLYPPEMVSEVIAGRRDGGVDRRVGGKSQ